MKKTISRILSVVLMLMLIALSALAVTAYEGETVLRDGFDAVVDEEAQPEEDVRTIQNEEILIKGGESKAKAAAAKYKITFYANGGGGEMETVTVKDSRKDGEAYVLPECGFTPPEGKDFNVWKIGSTAYDPGDTVTVTKSLTVRAAWKKHVHSYKWKVVRKASYFKAGKKKGECSCGANKVKTIPKKTARNKWVRKKENGKWYYFDKNGKKLGKGWYVLKERKSGEIRWCYLAKNGVYKKSISRNTRDKWINAGGFRFYFGSNRKPLSEGFHFIGSKLYYTDKHGAIRIGTFKASDGEYYTTNDDGSFSGLTYYRHYYKEFVLIDISEQTLYFYRDGKRRLTADVVTGQRNAHDTPTGIFSVRSKQRGIYLNGATWSSYVNYWIAFIGSSHGMHDASWRSSAEFSNHNTYIYNGSHGCVNMRYSSVQELYGLVSIGTPVIVQN